MSADSPSLNHQVVKESRFYWFVKKSVLPPFHWNQMLKGKERDIAHKPLNPIPQSA